ncbi:MAG: hypothetical protein QXU43_00075, partial [Thermoproteota archaeon]
PMMLVFKTLFLFTGIALVLFTISIGYFMEKNEAFMVLLGRFIAQVVDIFLLGVALILISGSLKYPFKIPSIRDSLSILVNLMSLVPLIKTLGIAASIPSFDLRILLYVSVLTLVLMYSVNILVFLITRFLLFLSKTFKIAIVEE